MGQVYCTSSVDRVYLHTLSGSSVFAHAQLFGCICTRSVFGCICTRSVVWVYLHTLSYSGVSAHAQYIRCICKCSVNWVYLHAQWVGLGCIYCMLYVSCEHAYVPCIETEMSEICVCWQSILTEVVFMTGPAC